MAEPWTPGPWTADSGTVWKPTGDGDKFAFVITATTTDADRRLIAAAPEMAALLADLVKVRRVDDYLNRNARALLARIRGEA